MSSNAKKHHRSSWDNCSDKYTEEEADLASKENWEDVAALKEADGMIGCVDGWTALPCPHWLRESSHIHGRACLPLL